MPKKVTTKPVAKKVTKKAVPKKAGKKVTNKKAEKKMKMLVCAPDDKCFWTTDGKILKNLAELQMAFGTMGDEVFLHHVTKEKNDFADWVEHVLEDARLAADLRKSKKPAKAQVIVSKHLRTYNV